MRYGCPYSHKHTHTHTLHIKEEQVAAWVIVGVFMPVCGYRGRTGRGVCWLVVLDFGWHYCRLQAAAAPPQKHMMARQATALQYNFYKCDWPPHVSLTAPAMRHGMPPGHAMGSCGMAYYQLYGNLCAIQSLSLSLSLKKERQETL